MKFKRLLAVSLSTCMMLGAVPAYAAEAPAEPAVVSETEEDVVLIPEELLGAMEEDAAQKDYFRFPSVKESNRFLRDMPQFYGSLKIDSDEVNSSHRLAALDSFSSLKKGGPIGVAPCTLNGEPVTLVVLGGTVPVRGQATGFKEDVLSAMECANDYVRNVVKLFDAVDENGDPVIPADKPVIVSGISLGGMVAQQLLAQKDLMERFDISEIICFGSPLLAAEYRTPDTRVVRFCDSADLVPYAGRPYMADMLKQKITNSEPSELIRSLDAQEVIRKDGGYRSAISAHTQSYVMNPCWKGYDALGYLNGGNELVMEQEMQYYPCPRLK